MANAIIKNTLPAKNNYMGLVAGQKHLVFYNGTCRFGGQAVTQSGECLEIVYAYKTKASAVKLLNKIAATK